MFKPIIPHHPDHHPIPSIHPVVRATLPKLRCALIGLSLCAAGISGFSAPVPVNVTMFHNDLAGTGQNLNESFLTPTNVNSATFGQIFSIPLDGYTFAVPLVLNGVNVPGSGTHNLVFVATAHDSVYAFDAESDSGANTSPIWQVSFINPGAGLTTVPSSVFGISDPVEFGVAGTPVIDPVSGTLYVVAKMRDTTVVPNVFHVRLYALDVATGAAKFGGPVEILGSMRGTGTGNVSGTISFNPLYQAGRCGLLLLNGVVYATFASQNDQGTYHGCIAGYNAQTLAQTCFFYTSPNGSQAGIWMSAAMPTADTNGNIYCITGNGTFDANTGGPDYGNSFLKLTPSGKSLAVGDYFTPFNQAALNPSDLDLGTCGALLLPDAAGSTAHPHLVVSCSKAGTMYLLDRDNMGHFNSANNNQIVQSFQAKPAWSTLAYFNNRIYFCPSANTLGAYSMTNAQMSTTPLSQTAHKFPYSGASPGISADGTNNAIAWVIERDASGTGKGPGVLWAFDAYDLTRKLYSSSDAGVRDQLPIAREFQVPVVANGRVYVATQSSLAVFGLFGRQQPQLAINASDLTLQGLSGNSYLIEYSPGPTTNAEWQAVATISLTNSVQSFPSPVPLTEPQGFFRATLNPGLH